MNTWILGVMDADSRAISITIDDCRSWDRRQGWLDHLADHDMARAAVEELIEAAQRVLDKEWEYGDEQPHCVRLNSALARATGGTK
jgi:hypothetical protein